MTITATASEIAYAGDGVSTVFAIPFPFDTSSDLKLTSTDSSGNITVLSSGFSISGGGGSTGNATFTTAPAVGVTITILDNPELTQTSDYVSNDPFPAEAHERALDRVTRITKRLYQIVQKSLRVSDGDPAAGAGMLLGSVDNRKGKYLFFNAVTGAIEYAAALVSQTLSQSIIGLFLYPQTTAEAAAGVTPTNYFRPEGDIRRYGANVLSADNSTALQTAINVCAQGGGEMLIPEGVYAYATGLTYTRTGAGGFKIRGIATSDYNSALTRGSVLSYTGSANAFAFDGSAAPIHVDVEHVAMLGTSSAVSGWRIRRATNINFRNCTVIGFSGVGAAAWLINPTATEYCGVIEFRACVARSCYYPWWLVKSPITVIDWIGCQTHGSCQYGIVLGENGVAANFRSLHARKMLFETNVSSDVLSWVQLEDFSLDGFYLENNEAAQTDPRIYIRGVGNKNIKVINGTISKQLVNATNRHIDINDADGVVIKDLYSAFPTAGAGVTDRFSVQLSSDCTDLDVELPAVVDGATAYPIRFGSTTYTQAINSRAQRFLGSTFLDGSITDSVTVNTQSSNYTFAATDQGQHKITVNGGAATTYTVPTTAAVNFAAKPYLPIIGFNSHSANNLTLARDTGVTMYLSNTNQNVTVGPRRFFFLYPIGTDTFVVDVRSGLS